MSPGDLRRLAVRLERFADFTRDPDRARQLAVDARLRAAERECDENPWEFMAVTSAAAVIADLAEAA